LRYFCAAGERDKVIMTERGRVHWRCWRYISMVLEKSLPGCCSSDGNAQRKTRLVSMWTVLIFWVDLQLRL
jgi:hypothetical protein